MRMLLVFVVVALCVLATNASLTCFADEEKCEADECCIQVGNTVVGVCKKKYDVGKKCELKPSKNFFKKHVYRLRCPCKDELKCVSFKEGIVGQFVGKCAEDSGEVVTESNE